MSFPGGDILLVPVVFTDGSSQKKRPVLIVYDSGDADLLVAPVTSQAARSWRDVSVVNWQQAGLRLPSIVRLEKLATVDKSTIVRKMGRLSPADWEKVKVILKEFFADILAAGTSLHVRLSPTGRGGQLRWGSHGSAASELEICPSLLGANGGNFH